MDIDKAFWRGKSVLVTGHTGFMGGWLTVALDKLDARVSGYALAPPTDPSFFVDVGVQSLLHKHVVADIRDLASLTEQIKLLKPEIIFHLAAQPLVREAYRDPVSTFDINVMGMVNLLEAARASETVSSIVVVTSDKVYDNVEWEWDYRENDRLGGREPYGVSKACAELVTDAYRRSYFEQGNVGIATVRAGNIVGGGDWAAERLIPDIVRAFSTGNALRLRNPAAVRPWQHVLEPVRGYLMLAQCLDASPNVFAGGWNFGPNREDHKPVSWVADFCAKLWGNEARWELEDVSPAYEAQRLGVSIAKADNRLGWQPAWRLETALEHALDWYRARIASQPLLEVSRSQVCLAIGE